MLSASIPPWSASCTAAWSTLSRVSGTRPCDRVVVAVLICPPAASIRESGVDTCVLYTVQSRGWLYSVQYQRDEPMQAMIQDTYGSAEVMQLREIDKPEIGENDVLVRVHAASIHVGDWILMTGSPFVMRFATGLRKPKNPIPGTDVAGTVEAVGKAVEGLRPGDDVFGWCAGAFAEYAHANENQFIKKPANLTFEQAAA